MVTLEQIRDAGTGYPTDVLDGCESALVLFAAGFHGRQDAVFMADAGLAATCVDTDAVKLGEMVLAYPEGWEYVVGDAYAYAENTLRFWDVVSVDPFSNQFQECADQLELWCSLAMHAVVLGMGAYTTYEVPAGWRGRKTMQRSRNFGGVWWAVFTRC